MTTGLAGSSKTLCLGDSVTLGTTSVSGVSYAWTILNPTAQSGTLSDASTANPSVNPEETTSYQLVYTDVVTSCELTEVITVTLIASPILTDAEIGPFCAPIAAQNLVAEIANYGTLTSAIWYIDYEGGTIESTPTAVQPTRTTEYFVRGYNSEGCSDLAIVRVLVEDPQTPNILPGTTVNCASGTVDLANHQGTPLDSNNSFEWHSDNTTNVATLLGSTVVGIGTYYVFEVSPNGCYSSSDSIIVSACSTSDPCNALASGNLDTDGDGISDMCDLDDDNDGITDVDEDGCVTGEYFIGWWHNNPYGDSKQDGYATDPQSLATIYWADGNEGADLSVVSGQGSDEILGSGVTGIFNGSLLTLYNVDQSTLSGAIADGDYVEYGFITTVGFEGTLDRLGFAKGDNSASEPRTASQTLTIIISDDNFSTADTLVKDYSPSAPTSWYEFEHVDLGSVNYSLQTSTNYKFRVFLYGLPAANVDTMNIDDYQLSAISCVDTDRDGYADYRDIDADNDGIVDNTEAQSTLGYVAPSGSDTDGDGLDDAYDTDCSPCGAVTGVSISPVDTDGDGTRDYLDADSDNDGISDLIEGHDTNGDGIVDGLDIPNANTGLSVGLTDIDGDGLLDGFDNDVSGLDPTNGNLSAVSHPDVKKGSSERDWREVAGHSVIGDYVWMDSNKDGIQDVGEIGISGVDVSLWDNNNNRIASTQTDALGKYCFTSLESGQYSISISLPSGFSFAPLNSGSNDSIDSDINTATGISDLFTLSDADTILLMDAGLMLASKATANLGDYVWLDFDSDNTQSVGDLGFAGIVVTLFDNTNSPIATTITDPSGAYLFTDIVPGSYRVGATLPIGYGFVAQTTGDATGSDIDPSTQRTPLVNLIIGEENLDLDIGLTAHADTTVSIGDYVWDDLNQDGIQDVGEPGLSNVKIILYNREGARIDSTTSNAFGEYIFTGLEPGRYHLEFVAPSGYLITSKYEGSDETIDSDIYPYGLSDVFVIFPGDRKMDLDAGMYQSSPSGTTRIGDRVWFDSDNDGIQDVGEPGAQGVNITLYTSSDVKMGWAVSDPNGAYYFTGLAAGSYYIIASNNPDGYGYSPAFEGGDNALDSDVDASGKSQTFTLSGGQVEMDLDIGLTIGIPPTFGPNLSAGVSGRSWNDVDADGIQDSGEMGIAGITVILYEEDNITKLDSVKTDPLGYFIFPELDGGNYSIEFDIATYPANYVTSSIDQGSDDDLDSDIQTGTGKTFSFAIGAGQRKSNIDAGLHTTLPGLSSLGDLVWNDLDGDGIFDAGEKGMQGINVTLFNDQGDTLAHSLTDVNGAYRFYDLSAGTYIVGFSNLPAGFEVSPEGVGGDESLDSDVNALSNKSTAFALSSATDYHDLDAGITASTALLGDYVWFDTNGDGAQDTGEPGLEGVVVTLYDNSDNAISAAVTDRNGRYTFVNLDAGTYVLGFSNLPLGTEFSPQDNTGDDTNDSDGNPSTLKTNSFVLTAASANVDIDQGVQPSPKAGLGNYIWYDKNVDGIQDSNERGIGGIRVILYDQANVAQSVGVTNGSGFYQFNNLTPGTYSIGLGRKPFNSATTDKDVVGATEATDSDINTGTDLSDPVVLGAGVFNNDMDGGLLLKAVLGGLAWFDNIRDGILDYSESQASGIEVELIASDSTTVLATTTTGSYFGSYFFTNLDPGCYFVRFKNLPPTYGFTIPNAGVNDRKDSDAVPAASNIIGTSFKVTLESGTINMFTYAGLSSTPFAVDWLEFTASRNGPDALIKWATAQEKNADYYEIQRSIDGNFFTGIGDEKAVGNTDNISEYQFTDPYIDRLPVDRVYYRLRQVDKDGKFDFSNIVELDLTATNEQILFTISPNPVRDAFDVNYTFVETEEMRLEVVNAVGQQMYTQPLENASGKLKIDVHQWSVGFYYVRLSGKNNQRVFKIQVVR